MVRVYRVETKIRRIGPFTGTNYYNTFGHRFMADHFPRFSQDFEDDCKDARFGVLSKAEMKKLLAPCVNWAKDGNKKDKRKIGNFVVRVYDANMVESFPDKQVMFERKNSKIVKEWDIIDFLKEGK